MDCLSISGGTGESGGVKWRTKMLVMEYLASHAFVKRSLIKFHSMMDFPIYESDCGYLEFRFVTDMKCKF